MEKTIKGSSYQAIGFRDFNQAINVLKTHKADLIFIHISNKSYSPFSISQTLRKLPLFSNTPIVLLTEKTNWAYQLKAKINGISDLLKIPVNSSKILEIIEKYIEENKIDSDDDGDKKEDIKLESPTVIQA